MSQRHVITAILVLLAAAGTVAAQADDAPPDPVLQALLDELDRTMTLQLADLQRPYQVQFTVADRTTHRIGAAFGAVQRSDTDRQRVFRGRVRVGSPELDNTGFAGDGGRRRRGGGRGGAVPLPLEDDYTAIRHAIWQATDRDYKQAVEELTRKRAYMEDKRLGDRPADFAPAEPTVALGSPVHVAVDHALWEQRLRSVSARFAEHPHLQDGEVDLTVEVVNRHIVTSEGTRVRCGEAEIRLALTARTQADDGDVLADGRVYLARSPAELPTVEELLAEVDAVAARLAAARQAPVLEDYAGPVLLEGVASPQLFHAMLGRGLAGQVDPVGTGRRRFRGTQNLERQLGKQILPESFTIRDDPTSPTCEGQPLAGHYRFDLEGMPAQPVHLVVEGRLVNMAMSRTPTARLSGSNGHGRLGSGESVQAGIGCLYVEADGGLDLEALRARLLEEAADQGLEYALRITALDEDGGGMDLAAMRRFMQGGGDPMLRDPIYVYKVFVEDGHEEPVRGCEFGRFSVRDLEDIVATGLTPVVYNHVVGGPPVSVIAPAIILEEAELGSIEQERDRLPLLPAPHAR
jgi:hypothetical protein